MNFEGGDDFGATHAGVRATGAYEFRLELRSGALALSPEALRLFGDHRPPPRTRGELVARARADQRASFDDALRAAAAGSSLDHEILIDGQGGAEQARAARPRWLLFRGVRARESELGPQLVGAVLDVTRLRDVHEALASRNHELVTRLADRTRTLTDAAHALATEMHRRELVQQALLHAQRLETVGTLTSGVAHDFNNALQPILSALELLDDATDDRRLKGVLSRALRASRQATGLVRSLLSIARKSDPITTLVDPAGLVRDLAPLVRSALSAKVSCAFALEPAAWPVVVEPARLEAALLNLVANARDAQPDGGSVEVAVRNVAWDDAKPSALRPGEYVALSLRDAGPGMSPEVLARATEPFFTTKGPSHGTGLGLAMVEALAVACGGALSLQNTSPTGLLAELFLPRASAGAGSVHASDTAPPARRGIVLCAIEDDRARALACADLRSAGHTVLDARDADVALALAHAVQTLDLVVVDLPATHGAPSEGAGLVARLRAERPGLPALVASHGPGGDEPDHLSRPYEGRLVDAVARRLAPPGALDEQQAHALERIRARVKDASLRALVDQWGAARGGAPLPRTATLETPLLVHAEHTFLALVEAASAPPTFRVLSVGRALAERLGYAPHGEVWASRAEAGLGSVEDAYRRAVRTRLPVYEYARFALDDGPVTLFERLLLPTSDDGPSPTHVFGVVLFTDAARSAATPPKDPSP